MINWLDTFLLLAVTFLAVFGEAAFQGLRHWLGVQVDLVPALMVYAGLRAGLGAVIVLALSGGLWFDSLSANPCGVSVLPLFVLGLILELNHELILRDQLFAQFVLGASVSLAAPLLTLILLLTGGYRPLIGWGTLWQLLMMSLAGGVATPVIFELMDWLHRLLGHQAVVETTFRADREIRRGRS